MLDPIIQAKVAAATVILPGQGGQGVLVEGNLILTAAHCIKFNCEGHMVLSEVLGGDFIEEIETAKGRLKVGPLAIEPVSDIAVLAALDGQVFYEESEAVEQFCRTTKPLTVGQRDYDLFKEFPAFVYNGNTGIWTEGTAQQCNDRSFCAMLWFDYYEQIEAGTSGGPIVDESGTLIGIQSNVLARGSEGKYMGRFPRPHLALPVWICRIMFEGGED